MITLNVCFSWCDFYSVLGSLFCWNRMSSAASSRDGACFCVFCASTGIRSASYKCQHLCPRILALWASQSGDFVFTVVGRTRCMLNMQQPFWAEQIYLGLSGLKNLLPEILGLLCMFSFVIDATEKVRNVFSSEMSIEVDVRSRHLGFRFPLSARAESLFHLSIRAGRCQWLAIHGAV